MDTENVIHTMKQENKKGVDIGKEEIKLPVF